MDSTSLRRRLELEQLMGVEVLMKPHAQDEPAEENSVKQQLAEIEKDVQQCTKCPLHKTRTQGVFARGRCDADLMFIGEAPGADEDRLGEPFVGRAGKLLDKMIEAMGLGRNDIYITNILKSRPPKNRDPRADETEACWPYLERQIELVDPDIIVTLGLPASNTLLDNKTSMSKMRGNWFFYSAIPVLPTYHPAYLLRSPSQKKKVWLDLRTVTFALTGEKPPPSPGLV
ncbi:MAG: uracil-DNA glycosylase [Planctomycetes bacterium]|nr:uracil-DNA glycosylase [Planctomycetota bacterium]